MNRQANRYSDLFYHCVQVLNEYPKNISEESFLEEYFQSNEVPNQSFVATILVDGNRHGKFLHKVVQFFFETNGKNVRRSEENVYQVITYLIFFQLDTIQLDLLRGFIHSFQLYQMHQVKFFIEQQISSIHNLKNHLESKFLQFICNENHLTQIRNDALQFYEDLFVDEMVNRILNGFLPELRGILLDVTDTLEGRSAPRQIAEPTKPKPFQLTAPKARLIPIPKIIPQLAKARAPPKTTYEPPREQTEIEKLRQANQRDAMTKLNQTRSLTFHHLQTEKTTKTRQRQAQIIEETEKTLQFERFRANPRPRSQSNRIPVKVNVATVLKESQLYRKQEDEIRRRLNDFESGGRDGQEFAQWQESMQRRDYHEQLALIEQKRLEGRISFEEAILARQRLAQDNRQIAEEIKRQTREAIDEHVRQKLKDEQRMKQLVEEVANGRDNAKVAQQKLQQYKTDFVKQYKEELKQMLRQALEEAESEMRQRAEIIHQIRAIESVPIDRWKPVDLTSVAGHGVHDEMSIVELRERLELAKLEREKERDDRRNQIIKDKQMKENQITNTIQNIVKYRNELTTQAAKRKQRQTSAPVTTPQIEILREDLKSKKSQRQQQRETFMINRTMSDPFSLRQPISRSTNEWQRFDQVEKSVHKAQKRLAPSLLA